MLAEDPELQQPGLGRFVVSSVDLTAGLCGSSLCNHNPWRRRYDLSPCSSSRPDLGPDHISSLRCLQTGVHALLRLHTRRRTYSTFVPAEVSSKGISSWKKHVSTLRAHVDRSAVPCARRDRRAVWGKYNWPTRTRTRIGKAFVHKN